MAEFEPAFEKMIRNEGGYVDHTVAGDRGGRTYAGITRNHHNDWDGWQYLDRGDTDNPALTGLVRDFYRENYWNRVRGDDIEDQAIAESVFDFAVNAGVSTSSKLAQLVVNATPDGRIGPKTLAAINAVDGDSFVPRFALAKVARYVEICKRDRGQMKFMLGWLNRTLKGVSA